MILNAFFAALGQIGDPRFRRVLWLGIGLTLALLIAVTYGAVALLQALIDENTLLFGRLSLQWLDTLLGWSWLILLPVLSIFLMVPVASAITSMFLDEVAQAVEDRHYPNLPTVSGVSILDGLRDTISFLGVLILANLLALVLYVLFSPAAPFIFWGLNGFLLGREYFTLAAMRRVGRVRARELRSAHSGTIWVGGILMAIPLSIPVVNLLIPILGAATFTHIYHQIARTS
ncbi:EI24 domain-containing protein [Thalassococcus sp. S3]|uniref:EI24 domain-containing protein n=1 Tax=Thalassococcus sp. S3 TaxID=2017482 RepID=UPI001024586F|nr:EI24 domain-containing protein [Thalassococcus sp. S3]QBF30953.1 hypothetical protein CFI11_06940 [Thalassococcus sp. S3]